VYLFLKQLFVQANITKLKLEPELIQDTIKMSTEPTGIKTFSYNQMFVIINAYLKLGPSNYCLNEKAFIIKRALGNYYSEVVILRILRLSGRLSLVDNKVYVHMPGAKYDNTLNSMHYLYLVNT
jgi:hypothetical protein